MTIFAKMSCRRPPAEDFVKMEMQKKEVHIAKRVRVLKQRAAQKFKLAPEKCHLGHVLYMAMMYNLNGVQQIDAGTDQKETHGSVLFRACRLATALRNRGLKVGDVMSLLGPNHLDLAVPYYACHMNGMTICTKDAGISLEDLKHAYSVISPKIVFCNQDQVKDVKAALEHNKIDVKVVVFDSKDNNLETFTKENKGTEVGYRPADFDQRKVTAWLMMTSGTTGRPKTAMIPYWTVLNAICGWWEQFTDSLHVVMTFGTIQWLSAMIFYISCPMMGFARLQSTQPITPQWVVACINKYKPTATAFTPHMLDRFLLGASHICNLTSFKYIAIGGSAIEKPLVERFKAVCDAYLYLVYGMTELITPVFEFNIHTPFGSSGKPFAKFQYRLVTDDGGDAKQGDSGELWIKGDEFFTGYLNNPEETRAIITEDGWIKTGDIFYKDENDYYFYVERKRLLIRSALKWVAPLQLEEVIKRHPGVAEVCVVGIDDPVNMELPVAAIVKKDGLEVYPQDVFDLIEAELPSFMQLLGGVFFMDTLPVTPSFKVHRSKIRDIAVSAQRILPKQ